ncbi:MAG: metal-dependent transcriptional regulator [Candidatus Gastranaerophilales bacterium]|nr:metal-dependent transcriptional regulator [Candidatus Gastranaerophilales bacterium]
MKLSESLEDYLEAIYNEILKKNEAKVTDISNILNVKKASVTGALINLKNKGLINYEPYSAITLTELGEKLAMDIIEKHKVMSEFLENILNLSKDEAIENACKMEHIMSETMFDRMTKFSVFIQELCKTHPELKEKISKLYE